MKKKYILSHIMLGAIISSTCLPTMTIFAAPKIQKPELPNIEFKRPANMPDINIDLSKEYNTVMKDLESLGFGKYEMNLKDKPIDKEFASQGLLNKLSDDELDNYIDNAKNKYLPQINASKEASGKIDYKPIDLSSKWNLMSKNEAEKMLTSLPNYTIPDYNSLKNNLSSTMPTLNHVPPAEFTSMKDKIQSAPKWNWADKLSGVKLPADVSINNNMFVDDRDYKWNASDTLNEKYQKDPQMYENLKKSSLERQSQGMAPSSASSTMPNNPYAETERKNALKNNK